MTEYQFCPICCGVGKHLEGCLVGKDNLEPCPFCGSDDVYIETTTKRIYEGVRSYEVTRNKVVCLNCNAHVKFPYCSKSETICKWNARVSVWQRLWRKFCDRLKLNALSTCLRKCAERWNRRLSDDE